MATSNSIKARAKTRVDVADVRYSGQEFIIPEGMTLKDADKFLHQRMEFEDQDVQISADFPGVFIYDGANACAEVLERTFGIALSQATPGFWGPIPPPLLSIATSTDTVKQVPWGRFSVPGVEGYITSAAVERNNRLVYHIGGVVKRRDEDVIKALVEAVKEYLRLNSIYRGKAIGISFMDEDGERKDVPEPRFLYLQPELRDKLIFSEATNASIETNIFTPIVRAPEARALGLSLKRGVILYGPYGTGKSMTSSVTAVIAVENGWTFISVDRADELDEVLKVARMYQPCVVFCEDIDRVMSGDRSISMDEILNLIDGIESKNTEIMVVLTTNHVEQINKALLRPGRLDAAIHVGQPDAKAAERLLRQYAGTSLGPDEDLSRAGLLLEGNTPAVLREAADRSIWSALKLTTPGSPADARQRVKITGDAIAETAETLQEQIKLLQESEPDTRSAHEKAAQIRADATRDLAEAIARPAEENGNGKHKVLAGETA